MAFLNINHLSNVFGSSYSTAASGPAGQPPSFNPNRPQDYIKELEKHFKGDMGQICDHVVNNEKDFRAKEAAFKNSHALRDYVGFANERGFHKSMHSVRVSIDETRAPAALATAVTVLGPEGGKTGRALDSMEEHLKLLQHGVLFKPGDEEKYQQSVEQGFVHMLQHLDRIPEGHRGRALQMVIDNTGHLPLQARTNIANAARTAQSNTNLAGDMRAAMGGLIPQRQANHAGRNSFMASLNKPLPAVPGEKTVNHSQTRRTGFDSGYVSQEIDFNAATPQDKLDLNPILLSQVGQDSSAASWHSAISGSDYASNQFQSAQQWGNEVRSEIDRRFSTTNSGGQEMMTPQQTQGQNSVSSAQSQSMQELTAPNAETEQQLQYLKSRGFEELHLGYLRDRFRSVMQSVDIGARAGGAAYHKALDDIAQFNRDYVPFGLRINDPSPEGSQDATLELARLSNAIDRELQASSAELAAQQTQRQNSVSMEQSQSIHEKTMPNAETWQQLETLKAVGVGETGLGNLRDYIRDVMQSVEVGMREKGAAHQKALYDIEKFNVDFVGFGLKINGPSEYQQDDTLRMVRLMNAIDQELQAREAASQMSQAQPQQQLQSQFTVEIDSVAAQQVGALKNRGWTDGELAGFQFYLGRAATMKERADEYIRANGKENDRNNGYKSGYDLQAENEFNTLSKLYRHSVDDMSPEAHNLRDMANAIKQDLASRNVQPGHMPPPPALGAYSGQPNAYARAVEKRAGGDMHAMYQFVTKQNEQEQKAAFNGSAKLREYLGIHNDQSFRRTYLQLRKKEETNTIPYFQAPAALATAAYRLDDGQKVRGALTQMGKVLNEHPLRDLREQERTVQTQEYQQSVEVGFENLVKNLPHIRDDQHKLIAINMVGQNIGELSTHAQMKIRNEATRLMNDPGINGNAAVLEHLDTLVLR